MKPAPLILTLSVAANLALAAWVYSRRSDTASASQATSAHESAASKLSESGTSALANATAAANERALVEDARFIARLRAEGCPPDILHALAWMRINERYADRVRELRGPADQAYWNVSFDRAGTLSREQRTKMRELGREMVAELRQICGGEEFVPPYQREQRERMMGNLAPEKVREVEAIDRDYRELMAEVRGGPRGILLPAQREELRLLEKERRADLAAVLTPEELLEYDLRASPSANAVREKLAFFGPTEAEYRALVKLQLEFDQVYGAENLSPAERARRRAAEQELAQKIATVLTPERLAEYEIVTDESFRNTDTFVRSYNLDPAVAREVVALQRSVKQRAAAISQQSDLDDAQRAAATATLAQEATEQLSAKFSPEILTNYQKTAAGNWLRRLRQPPRRPANAPSR